MCDNSTNTLMDHPKRRRSGEEDAPRHESMRRPWLIGGVEKERRDHKAPIKRFLRKNVGRPWDKVYNELRKTAINQYAEYRLIQRITREVERDVVMEGGLPYHSTHRFDIYGFYINPNTGILCEVTGRRFPRYRYKKEHKFVPIDSNHYYRVIGNIWYEITLSPIPLGKTTGRHAWDTCVWAHDMVVRSDPRFPWVTLHDLIREHGQSGVYATAKRQLNSREIRRILPQAIKLGLIKPGRAVPEKVQ